MKLKSKLFALVVTIFLSLVTIALVGLQVLRVASEADNYARIEQLLKSTYSVIAELEKMTVEGKVSEQEAKSIASQILRENKYHPSEYVYVTDEKLDFVATPHDPQLEGTSFNDFRDAQGNSIGALVSRLARGKSGVLITYDWTSIREKEVVNLTSVVQKSPHWGWYVGTGISYKESNARYWSTAKWLLTISILIAIAIAYFLFRFGHKLTRDLGAEVSEVLDLVLRVSRGDLRDKNKHTDADRDSVMGSLLYMQNALREVVTEIHAVGDTLSAHALESEKESATLDKLVLALDTNAESASSALNQIAVGAQKANNSNELNAVKVKEAKLSGEAANSLTHQSAQTVITLEEQIASAVTSVHVLGTEVKKIETVLSVIRGIAEQTNLLALNAAIEAARAGDQGRGFAVVADEVRQLAQRTQESTQEIQNMIENLQSAADEAITLVESSINTGQHSVDQSKEASVSIAQLQDLITSISVISEELASTASEQLSGASEVNNRIEQIAHMTHETALTAKKANEKNIQVRKSSQSLKKETEKFIL